MKLVTVLGTRPEIIRLSILIGKLDGLCSHTIVHTGQNSDPALSDVFFAELGVRRPDVFLGVDISSPGRQIGGVLEGCERVFREKKPDRVLVLGDTNSALSVIMAKRMGIPVFHMEAGNRCFDDRVPEEVNRRIVDSCSDVLMPYTERSRTNLLREGYRLQRILVTGNPINEILERHRSAIDSSAALDRLGLQPGGYFLVTAHRAENVDLEPRLKSLFQSLSLICREYGVPAIVSTHPRTRDRLASMRGLEIDPLIRLENPFGLFDFVKLEKNARCVLSDSGTVQEECCILRVPNVTLRDVTERPETVECGSNILAGVEPPDVARCVAAALARKPDWTPPPEYMVEDVSGTVASILMSRLEPAPPG
ncbi:MAG TPA: UDP-N-acetylglucosamine 2-epimerase (non-hydrolyzing) [Candidatus Fermentibacter daniensis]|nr:UDP-N-acetylglucosamine 2-epimerase (non-hydrolyzing) [Candidatus Fermentibacter daniensis]